MDHNRYSRKKYKQLIVMHNNRDGCMADGCAGLQVDGWDTGIRRITLNRPKVRNAYRSHTAVEPSRAIEDFTARPPRFSGR